jgi:hypothetical protein
MLLDIVLFALCISIVTLTCANSPTNSAPDCRAARARATRSPPSLVRRRICFLIPMTKEIWLRVRAGAPARAAGKDPRSVCLSIENTFYLHRTYSKTVLPERPAVCMPWLAYFCTKIQIQSLRNFSFVRRGLGAWCWFFFVFFCERVWRSVPHTHTPSHTNTHKYTHTRTRTQTHTYMLVYIYMYLYLNTCTQTHTHILVYIYIYLYLNAI